MRGPLCSLRILVPLRCDRILENAVDSCVSACARAMTALEGECGL